MKVIEALNSRFTNRAFRPDPVDEGTILKIMEAAVRSPSQSNTQPWEVFVATGEALDRARQGHLNSFRQGVPFNFDLAPQVEWPSAQKQRANAVAAERNTFVSLDSMDKTARRVFLLERNLTFFGAPVVAFLCMDPTLAPWSIFDLGVLAQSIMLAAGELGLSSAPAHLMVAYPDVLRAELDIPGDLSIVMAVALGYSDEQDLINTFRSSRRPLHEVVRLRGFAPSKVN